MKYTMHFQQDNTVEYWAKRHPYARIEFITKGPRNHGVRGASAHKDAQLWLAWHTETGTGQEPLKVYPETKEEQDALVALCKARWPCLSEA